MKQRTRQQRNPDLKRLSPRARMKLTANRKAKGVSPKLGKLDPSRTAGLRRAFEQRLAAQFAALKGAIVKAVGSDNQFGLQEKVESVGNQSLVAKNGVPETSGKTSPFVADVLNCQPDQLRGADGRCGPGIGLGISREDMPQIPKERLQEFVLWLRGQGVGVSEEQASVDEMQPVQADFRQERVDAIPDDAMRQPIIVANSNPNHDELGRFASGISDSSVDDLKLSDGVKSALKEVLPRMHELAKTDKREHQVIFDAKTGKVLHTSIGRAFGESSEASEISAGVSIPHELLTGDNSIVQVHTHPEGGGGPSDADWGMMGWGNLHSMLMVGPKESYAIQHEGGRRTSPRDLRESWEQIESELENAHTGPIGDIGEHVRGLIHKTAEGIVKKYPKYKVHVIPAEVTTNSSSNRRILDGTHRWIKAKQDGVPQLPVIAIDLPADEALEMMRRFEGVRFAANDLHQPFVLNGEMPGKAKVGWFPCDPREFRLNEVPDVRQPNGWSCGAAAVRGASLFFGWDTGSIEAVAAELGTTEDAGTRPQAIAKFFRQREGAIVRQFGDMDIDQLAWWSSRGCLILCPVQDWMGQASPKGWESGHWLTVLGVGMGYVFCQDSSLENAEEVRTDNANPNHDELGRFASGEGKTFASESDAEKAFTDTTAKLFGEVPDRQWHTHLLNDDKHFIKVSTVLRENQHNVRLDFGTFGLEYDEQNDKLSSGSLSLLREVRRTIAGYRDAGFNIEVHPADAKRKEVFDRLLRNGGMKLVQDYDKKHRYQVWNSFSQEVVNEDGNIHARGRVMVCEDDWLKVWHDADASGRKWVRWGIVVGREGMVRNFDPDQTRDEHGRWAKQEGVPEDPDARWLQKVLNKMTAYSGIKYKSPPTTQAEFAFHRRMAKEAIAGMSKGAVKKLAKRLEEVKIINERSSSYSTGYSVIIAKWPKDQQRGVWAHEFGHILDGGISQTPEWKAAWQHEIADKQRISEYAGTVPVEGFAEFFRMNDGLGRTPEGRRQIENVFPRCVAVLEKEGLW